MENRFGDLLHFYRDRSYDPMRKRSLTQERLAELLGIEVGRESFTYAAVSEWELGNTRPGKRRTVVALITVLHRLDGIREISEADDLLRAAEYSHLDDDERLSIFGDGSPGATQTPPFAWPPDIPEEAYYPLPGRERDLAEVLEWLADANGPQVIAVDGLGGLGKTALAAELARRAVGQGIFEQVIGDSAKNEILAGGEIVRVREATLDFDGLLNAIAGQLGRWEITTFKADEKQAALAHLLGQRRYLILVDNLETAENAQALVVRLHTLTKPSRAILTTRQKVPHDFVRSLSLAGLELEDSLAFLRTDASRRGVSQILEASDERLAEIHSIAGGAPLALKLVVAQAQFLELEPVLAQLKRAGSDLYPFLFRQSWGQLRPAAQRLLIYIGRTVMTTVGWEELSAVQVAEDEQELLEAIRQLTAHSLLEISTTTESPRYGIHSLTRQFVNSDLPSMWREQGLP